MIKVAVFEVWLHGLDLAEETDLDLIADEICKALMQSPSVTNLTSGEEADKMAGACQDRHDLVELQSAKRCKTTMGSSRNAMTPATPFEDCRYCPHCGYAVLRQVIERVRWDYLCPRCSKYAFSEFQLNRAKRGKKPVGF